MKEKMTEWQKLAAVYGKAADESGKWAQEAVDFSTVHVLGIMAINNEYAYAAAANVPTESGKAEIALLKSKNADYVLVFPDEETAEKIGERCVKVPVRTLFGAVADKENIKGLQLVCAIDEKAKTFSAAEISRKLVLEALEIRSDAKKAGL